MTVLLPPVATIRCGDDIPGWLVLGYRTANQGGQTINFYLHYRYRSGLPTAKYPNYEAIRGTLLSYMGHVNAKRNLFWEILNTQICGRILQRFPLQAISCQFQVYPDRRPGLPYEPGWHDSVVTYGDIQPLTIPGPVPAAAGPR